MPLWLRTLVWTMGSLLCVAGSRFGFSGEDTTMPNDDQPVARGRFGNFVDARLATPTVEPVDAYSRAPLTVECRTRLFGASGFNVLVSNHSKESSDHWEIYSYIGSGMFSAYLPGFEPSEILSKQDVADGAWHHVAMTFDGQAVGLFVDGVEVHRESVRRKVGLSRKEGPLVIGGARAESGPIGCDGLIDEVRVSNTIRTFSEPPSTPYRPDGQTVGLWHLDRERPKGTFADSSASKNPARYVPLPKVPLDELDNASFKAGPRPMDSRFQTVRLAEGGASHSAPAPSLLLDGPWEMAPNGKVEDRLGRKWTDAIPATVPGSVHTALERAGVIPDPKFGRNDAIAHDKSFETWWFKKTFARPAFEAVHLRFGGVANRCTVWLNGRELGSHEGMFGGPEFDIPNELEDENTLVVRIDPAPGKREDWDNPAWRETVTFNNVYGWHYSSIPALGIWRSVELAGIPRVALRDPFIATKDAAKGLMDLAVSFDTIDKRWQGELVGTIEPDNFQGKTYSFRIRVDGGKTSAKLRFAVPEPRLWWPNGMGDPNLYQLRLSLQPEDGIPDHYETTFGIRTIAMAPFPEGPNPRLFNWTFVVNKKPMFVKGTGWCTMDSSMDFSRERYARFIELAKLQNVQMLRAWGSGMPETDDFFDLCDRNGILVMQEWPTAWNSHNDQPFEALEETVRLNTLRLRNHPSLAMYTGGNESGAPFGKAIDRMGRLGIELDGTRAFHRGEPWGGSIHNYDCYWGYAPLDRNLNLTARFFGEFGLASMPVRESVLRYLPDSEKGIWPPPQDGTLTHHTPKFNTAEDWKRLDFYSKMFSKGSTLQEFIIGSQLAQAVGVRHTLERARTRWPECTGAFYYKMNDNYPAASWSCVDWYGAPKIGHYVFQDAFAPLHACVVPSSLECYGKELRVPVFLLDDALTLEKSEWEVRGRAYDGTMKKVGSCSFSGSGLQSSVSRLGEFVLEAEKTATSPLFLVTEVFRGGALADRSFVFLNFERQQGCLFDLPPTTVSLVCEEDHVLVRNVGSVPAVGVSIVLPGHADTFTAADGFFWLDPGESKTVKVDSIDGLEVEGLNVAGFEL